MKNWVYQWMNDSIGMLGESRRLCVEVAWLIDHSQRKSLESLQSKLDSALTDVYPDLTEPRLPLPLPLAEFSGLYFHPGYQFWNITVSAQAADKGPTLSARFLDSTWPTVCEIEHVSGIHWLSFCDMVESKEFKREYPVFRDYAAVRFNVGSNAKVQSVTVDFRDINAGFLEGSINFQRVFE
jgi:hypothetical protein